MATVIISAPLRKYTNNTARLNIAAGNIQHIMKELSFYFPDLNKHLLDENGKIRSGINVFVDENNITDLQQESTGVNADTVISIEAAKEERTRQITLENPYPKPHTSNLSPQELTRYNRHIILPDFGLEAQQKLKAAKVLVIGSGGLGSPLLLYLAAAGVGTIGIVDFDVVEDSNLHRQVLFGMNETGKPKVEAAKRRLEQLNPYINIVLYYEQLTSDNAMEIIQNYDVVADGTDNFPTRYLVNDACVLLDKPNVYASVFQFEGQVSVFNYRNAKGETGPNYRDLFPTPPPPGMVQSCAEGGVLGVLPGIVGSLQALEVIKVITGVGETMSGRLFVFDALSFETRTFKIKRNPANPLNGTYPTITGLIDYEQFCGVKAVEKPIKEISAKDLCDWQVKGEPFQLIDVREPDEYRFVNIGAELIPLSTISSHADNIARDKKVVIHCKMGERSAKAIRELEEKFGLKNLYNLKGGIMAYIDEVKPDLANY